jgi:hypothetical protein
MSVARGAVDVAQALEARMVRLAPRAPEPRRERNPEPPRRVAHQVHAHSPAASAPAAARLAAAAEEAPEGQADHRDRAQPVAVGAGILRRVDHAGADGDAGARLVLGRLRERRARDADQKQPYCEAPHSFTRISY